MEKVTTKRLALYSGRTHPELAQEVATHLDIELGHTNIVEFANGEIRRRFGESDPWRRRLRDAEPLRASTATP